MVTLEDCILWSESAGWKHFRNILLALPKRINLYGIKREINNYQIGHEQFENEAGSLYVACDFCVRYQATGIQVPPSGFEFRSHHGWPDFKGRVFAVFSTYNLIRKSDAPEVILDKIKGHPTLPAYLDSFFNWLNISIARYPLCFEDVPPQNLELTVYGVPDLHPARDYCQLPRKKPPIQ